MIDLKKWPRAAGLLWCAAAAAAGVTTACGGNSNNSKPATMNMNPVPASWPGLPAGPIGKAGAARLLTQGTFGATLDGIQSTTTMTYQQWFDQQVAATMSLQTPLVASSTSNRYVPWWTAAVTGPDQLRQRAAFALSEILVVSSQSGALADPQVMTTYEDLLLKGAFGNFRDLLDGISHSATMGTYLSFYKNTKADPTTGSHADENYAREVMQLFTVGLVKLNTDGSPMVDSGGIGLPTYGLPEVENLARVFTGWGSQPVAPQTVSDAQAWLYTKDLLHPMACYPSHHDTDAKTIIDGVVIPAGGTCDSDMKIALDTLFKHPNVGPFIGKQLIQRLVTSNPSPAYIGRVAAAFANDGHGTRGNMLAVFEAILTDTEARTAGTAAKLREPILRFTNLYRAFSALDQGDGNIGQSLVYDGYGILDQEPYFSPTVFNFFRPDYLRPGALLAAGLAAPEFQITNEYSAVQMANQIELSTYQYADSSGAQYSGVDGFSMPTDAQSVILKTKDWEQYASTPATLADNLGLVFMEGQMPAAMKSTLVGFITGINGVGKNDTQDTTASATAIAAQRVIDAAFLVVSSPQYLIQR